MSEHDRDDAKPEPGAPPAADDEAREATPGVGEPTAPAVPAPAAEPPATGEPPHPTAGAAKLEAAPEPPPAPSKRPGPLVERPEVSVEIPQRVLEAQSRRDFLLYAAGLLATAIGTWWLLPDPTRGRLVGMSRREHLDSLAARVGLSRDRRERTLDRVLTFDDDVSEALYSSDRRVRAYRRSDVTPLRNNYHGATPGPEYLPTWALSISGLASGRVERLAIDELLGRFPHREQVTRLVCVEGWSAIAWWAGIRFADLLAAFPPAPGARWAALRSAVSIDRAGRPEPYYVSIDLGTARHPQTLLATHHDGQPLTVAHGAPMRLVAPVKLGLKNIKAITDIAYSANEPPDYWSERGYSKYDGL